MIRTRTRLVVVILAATAAAGAAGCGGSGDATQEKIEDKVLSQIEEDGFLFDDRFDGLELSEEDAENGAECVANRMFESDAFTKDERNDVARATNGDPPDADLVAKVVALVDECFADLGTDAEGS